ncbi:MAG TPA: hypothetical protein VGM98_10870 [Schlesneria sp.]
MADTQVWQRVEETFRITHGRAWRRAAASAFHSPKPALRASIDTEDLSAADVAAIDDILVEQLERRSRRLQYISEAEQATMRVKNARFNERNSCEIEKEVDLSDCAPFRSECAEVIDPDVSA